MNSQSITLGKLLQVAGPQNQSIKFLLNLAMHAASDKATDFYVREGFPTVFEARDERQHAVNWELGEKGVAPTEILHELIIRLANGGQQAGTTIDKVETFTAVVHILSGDAPDAKGNQLRVQYNARMTPRELTVRRQPSAPTPLEKYLVPPSNNGAPAAHILQNPTVRLLRSAEGLILICGPMGGGKTSLLTSIVEFWARHGLEGRKGTPKLSMIGDPNEFVLPPDKYLVSTIECPLTSSDGIKSPLDQELINVLRSNVDAFSVGEIRDAQAVGSLLKYAGTREPVVSTFHASSIADCVVRILGLAGEAMDKEIARLKLAACLQGVFFVNLVYDEKSGDAVPLVEFLNTQTLSVRNAIADGKARELAAAIESAQKNPGGFNATGDICRRQALAHAQLMGIPEAVAQKALGRLG